MAIADKWFLHYGLSNKITFEDNEYYQLKALYPEIHKLAHLEHSDLPNAENEIENKSKQIVSANNRIVNSELNISNNQFQLNRFIDVWKKIKDETGKIYAFARYQIRRDGENLSSSIFSDYQSLGNINVSSIETELETLKTEKNIIIDNISSIKSEYKILDISEVKKYGIE